MTHNTNKRPPRPTPYDDIIDSWDVIEAIAQLRDLRQDWDSNLHGEDQPWVETFPEEAAELNDLEALSEEACLGAGDGEYYGATLIRDSYFITHAQEEAEAIGNVTLEWPLCCIDWVAAAKMLQQDYFTVPFAGITYWIRS